MNRMTFERLRAIYGDSTAQACALAAGVCLACVQLWLKTGG